LEWANNAIQNTWLQIIVKANANTGFTTLQTFYIGHAMAEVNGVAAYRVTGADLSLVQCGMSIPVAGSVNEGSAGSGGDGGGGHAPLATTATPFRATDKMSTFSSA
jgi:hypothetical protein